MKENYPYKDRIIQRVAVLSSEEESTVSSILDLFFKIIYDELYNSYDEDQSSRVEIPYLGSLVIDPSGATILDMDDVSFKLMDSSLIEGTDLLESETNDVLSKSVYKFRQDLLEHLKLK
jgi:hypothetical protein